MQFLSFTSTNSFQDGWQQQPARYDNEQNIVDCENTLPETNIAPKNWWLEDEFRFGKPYFQVLR